MSQRPGAHGARVSFVRRFRVGLLSLAGLLTPVNLGTDVLRSLLGRKYLGLGYAPTASASIIARESKLHVSVVLLAMVAATTGVGTKEIRGPLLAAFAALLGLVHVAAEWEGLRLCFQSLGVSAEPIITLAAYAVLHLLSRLPVPRVGVGVVETGGFGCAPGKRGGR